VGQECARELQDLTAVHAFYLSLLDKHLGHTVPLPSEVKQAQDSPDDASTLVEALKFWLDLLDMAITPPMIREALKRTPGPDIAHALLRYFVTKASTRVTDRDKTDCVVTHLFRAARTDSRHQWERPEVDCSYYQMSQAALTFEGEIYRALGEVQFESMAPQQVQLLREFEYFHQELEEFRYFDQITDSTIVQRVRELKQSLGTSLYHPDSLANVAAWNDVFGRRFDELFHDATSQIKTFAEHVKREGGSILSRVEGDVTVKNLVEIETQEILAEDYQNAQDQFRTVSKYKKAVDHKRGPRRGEPPSSQPQAAPAPVSIPPYAVAPTLQPASARTFAPPKVPAKQATEVLAAPSPAVQKAVYEGKIHSTKETIKNYVRNADPKLAHIVPVQRGNITLSGAEVEAFRVDYGGEKSFRADYANILLLLVSYHARMLIELDEYNQKSNSAYLWKPHADALTYLRNSLERLSMEAEHIKALARQRGLQDKAGAVDTSLDKVKKFAQTVSQTLQAASQSYSS
jgi:hypothetical protein